MSATEVVVTVGAITGLVVGIATVIKELVSWRSGVRARESEGRRDTVADRDALIDQLQEENARLRVANASLTGALDETKSRNRRLVDHIYKRRPPPPPD